jgi:hypothetical protein
MCNTTGERAAQKPQNAAAKVANFNKLKRTTTEPLLLHLTT